MKLIRIDSPESPISATTARVYHSRGKHPELIIKVLGRLYVDLDVFMKMASESRNSKVKVLETINL